MAPSDEADPIELSNSAASKWGAKKLQRFHGEGSVALEGYKDERNVKGQLVMFDDYFSFTWVPMKHTVFFSRPSAKLTIDLLRDVVSKEDEVDNMREHISRCFSKDAVIDRSYYGSSKDSVSISDDEALFEKEPFRRILRDDDALSITEESGKIEPATTKMAFLRLNKLKGYIDDIFLG